ncbi:PREDICTED: uncharacterized protein LOC105967859 [Erythranthe guttata]|uniref:uncharacterized protein LOC105967859 n=1 Tax=Erythranthe guttata TaxID=4155 RepID=UPI00064E0F9A|nr:PREDICTED: uncharacterized protein LOC105967859 [Erythranthe guttata]|eukprot:XP_012847911.1 PREDICTED: uncharacterized protein LOC105967859 [Erythranthe guttata]
MACGGEVFEKSIQTPIQEKIQLDTGAKTLGVHKIERVLPIGTCLTVVGEVIKDEAGNFVIQKLYGGHPFYVSYRSVSEIIENFRETSRFSFSPCITSRKIVFFSTIINRSKTYQIRTKKAFATHLLQICPVAYTGMTKALLRFCMYASAAFGLIGVVLIAKHAFQYMEFKKMQKR